mmetsp:Transcript_55803/g.129972  ORF Transcript_55803/g.129972 Transcript_55803/m.129972 type:complete len:364 (+) Transcript_55803:459-1550(+)
MTGWAPLVRAGIPPPEGFAAENQSSGVEAFPEITDPSGVVGSRGEHLWVLALVPLPKVPVNGLVQVILQLLHPQLLCLVVVPPSLLLFGLFRAPLPGKGPADPRRKQEKQHRDDYGNREELEHLPPVLPGGCQEKHDPHAEQRRRQDLQNLQRPRGLHCVLRPWAFVPAQEQRLVHDVLEQQTSHTNEDGCREDRREEDRAEECCEDACIAIRVINLLGLVRRFEALHVRDQVLDGLLLFSRLLLQVLAHDPVEVLDLCLGKLSPHDRVDGVRHVEEQAQPGPNGIHDQHVEDVIDQSAAPVPSPGAPIDEKDHQGCVEDHRDAHLRGLGELLLTNGVLILQVAEEPACHAQRDVDDGDDERN